MKQIKASSRLRIPYGFDEAVSDFLKVKLLKKEEITSKQVAKKAIRKKSL